MPLPSTDVTWPPAKFDSFFKQMSVHSDWYAGDIEALSGKYRNEPITHRAQHNGGVIGAATRAWLGRPGAPSEARARVHIPVPAHLATLSADYLFGEAPRIVLPGRRSTASPSARDKQQDRAEKVINTPRVHSTLLESGEVAAALGGAYLRLVWDRERLTTVRAEAVHADSAIPVFRFGDLAEVTFWSQLDSDDKKVVWRHLELHSPGAIEHGLYAGTSDKLGRRMAVQDHPATEWLAAPGLLNEDSQILTGVPGLTAAYVPNMRPNAQFRKVPHLSLMGQSDFAQITQLFDAIDEVWSSWMRDIRIAKGRITVPAQYLQSGGFGQGGFFDYDREVYEALNAITGPDGSAVGITANQFHIRVEEHSRTINDLRDQAMRSAGWTPGSAGGTGEGIRTATEINADERLSARTRAKKTNYWKTLSPFFLTWLQLDAIVYGHPAPDEEPEVRFPAEAQVDIEKMSRTTQMLFAAQSASVETRVRMLHPDWDGDTVNAEVAKIMAENGIQPAADPTRVTGLEEQVTAATKPTLADVERLREQIQAGE